MMEHMSTTPHHDDLSTTPNHDDGVPLSTLGDLVPLGLLSLEGYGTVAQISQRLGSEVVVDDAGIRCCSRATARRLHDERAAVMAAVRARMAAVGDQSNVHAVLAARRERQLALRRAHPELGALAVAALDSGDPDHDLDRAGRHFDEMLAATRKGVAGFMHRYPTKES